MAFDTIGPASDRDMSAASPNELALDSDIFGWQEQLGSARLARPCHCPATPAASGMAVD
jgi:hypothetical protein